MVCQRHIRQVYYFTIRNENLIQYSRSYLLIKILHNIQNSLGSVHKFRDLKLFKIVT